MGWIILQMGIAWFYSHVLEYCLHKWLLHVPHRKKWFKTHFGDHHKAAKRNFMYDPKYAQPVTIKGDPEVKGLIILGLAHAPIAVWFPWAYLVLVYSAFSYFFVHRRAHQDITWGREYLSWHYDHHMYKDQHKNWGVRLPIIDWLVGSRVKWKNSPEEQKRFKRFRRKLRYINEFRSRSDKCKRIKAHGRMVRDQSKSRDSLSG